jgi:hypothetical protein
MPDQVPDGDSIAVGDMTGDRSRQKIGYHAIGVEDAFGVKLGRDDSQKHFRCTADSKSTARSHRNSALRLSPANTSDKVCVRCFHEEDGARHSILMCPFQNRPKAAAVL